jgi:hypothetical protein
MPFTTHATLRHWWKDYWFANANTQKPFNQELDNIITIVGWFSPFGIKRVGYIYAFAQWVSKSNK